MAGKHNKIFSVKNRPACACAVLWCVFLLTGIENAWPAPLGIDSVLVCNGPTVRTDSILYTMDLFFHEHPKNYWFYFDNFSNAVVIEFFDAQLQAPVVKIPLKNPFKAFKVNTVQSSMAITGVVSKIIVTIAPGEINDRVWTTDVHLINDATLRMVIGKKMMAYDERIRRAKTAHITALFTGASLSLVIAAIGILLFWNLQADRLH
jgi:hypothetical protein